jgi:hypothetical protein
MKDTNQINSDVGAALEASTADQLLRLLDRPAKGSASRFGGVVVGELLGIKDEGRTPLVSYPRQLGAAAVAARSVVDLHTTHIGRQVVLVFEDADPARPIIIGAFQSDRSSLFETRPGHVEVDTDGQRMIISAKEQLVLRCGDASLTLTKDGKVLLRGKHLSSHAFGVNRIKGGSVQIN